MPYDRSWMGFGTVGALQAGGIALVVGILIYALVAWMGKSGNWSFGKSLGVAFAMSFVIAGGQDLWDLFYFDLIPPQSILVLRNKLAAVHDPDAIGTRVCFEAIGALIGVFVGSAIFSNGLRHLMESLRSD